MSILFRKRRIYFLLGTIFFILTLIFLCNHHFFEEESDGGKPQSVVVSVRREGKTRTFAGLPKEIKALNKLTVPPGGNGYLNVAIWMEFCGDSLKSLKNYPVFPHGPSTRTRTSNLEMVFTRHEVNYGLRMHGFLSPQKSANYDFQLSSSGSAELWISMDSEPKNSKLIGKVVVNQNSRHLKEDVVHLNAGQRYYVEILHKHGETGVQNYVSVKWRLSDDKSNNFVDIPSTVLAPYEDTVEPFVGDQSIHPIFSYNQDSKEAHNMHVDPRYTMYHLPFIPEEDAQGLFPPCQYNPSYLVKGPLERYQATWETHYSSLYPADNLDIISHQREDFKSFGNDALPSKDAETIISLVWTAISSKHPGKYTLQQALNVEGNHDTDVGDRYLVELELQDVSTGKPVRFSEYVYQPWGSEKLCSPEGVAWNKSAVINIIMATGNHQGRWILHFINNMAKITKETKDFSWNLIIADFDSKDIDLEKALETSSIPNYVHLNILSKFQKAYGLQLAADMIKDPNSIVVVVDLHLDIPYYFLDDVRKHTVKNKIVFAPLLARLDCGATASEPSGFWETFGYGLIGLYKTDWDRVGGMNIKEFKKHWGGEDWEICDRIMMEGMEIERLKMRRLYHYFHTKKGLWANSN